MAKSKLIQANEVIAENVTGGFQKMCDGVVGAYTKVEDAFVDRYLTHDGETIEEAKARLAQENEARLAAAAGTASATGAASAQASLDRAKQATENVRKAAGLR